MLAEAAGGRGRGSDKAKESSSKALKKGERWVGGAQEVLVWVGGWVGGGGGGGGSPSVGCHPLVFAGRRATSALGCPGKGLCVGRGSPWPVVVCGAATKELQRRAASRHMKKGER